MAGPKTETIKEETMRRTGMTSKAYDKIHKGYELTQPEAYKRVKDAMDKEDIGRTQNKEKKATKEIEKRLIESGNRNIKEEQKKGKAFYEAQNPKKASGGAIHTMPDGTKMKGAKHGMKHGGKVKKCRMDGIALRGKTRAKQRSK
tara:strand:- start:278 stop:712 length:435 start_codon:yes stop_codon:yes gene_type:complete